MCEHPNRETAMIVLARKGDGTPTIWCDPCIASIVRALNFGGVPTVWSCCGHGQRPGVVGLADGRQLVIAADLDECQKIGALFPLDVNGAQHIGSREATDG